jgi:hypothetical protein
MYTYCKEINKITKLRKFSSIIGIGKYVLPRLKYRHSGIPAKILHRKNECTTEGSDGKDLDEVFSDTGKMNSIETAGLNETGVTSDESFAASAWISLIKQIKINLNISQIHSLG